MLDVTDVREEFIYLNRLRQAGTTNMFGATPYLQDEFGIDRNDAKDILMSWIEWVQEDHTHVTIGVDDEDYDDDDDFNVDDLDDWDDDSFDDDELLDR